MNHDNPEQIKCATVAELLAELEREAEAHELSMAAAKHFKAGDLEGDAYWSSCYRAHNLRQAANTIKQTLATMEARNAND